MGMNDPIISDADEDVGSVQNRNRSLPSAVPLPYVTVSPAVPLSRATLRGPADYARKYAVASGKMVAGVVRFVFEDVLQSGCQGIWLIKKWKSITVYSKAFTLCSMSSGLLLSFAGPFYEFCKLQQIKEDVRRGGDRIEFERGFWEAADQLETGGPNDKNEESLGNPYEKDKIYPANYPAYLKIYPAHLTIAEFLSGGASHGMKAHRALVMSAFLFWSWMGVYPKALDSQITCDGSPPALGLQLFFGLLILDILLQAWVLNHTLNGYKMLIDNIAGFLSGIGFSFLGRFDTYGDVSFTFKLLKCEEITWFSIHDAKYHLPCPLHYVALFALIIGILCFQALPGLFFLVSKRRLPLAMKLNEFNLILSVMALDGEGIEE